MSFRAFTEPRTIAGRVHDVCVLASDAAGCRAEVWPSLGANVLRWQATVAGTPHEILYAPPVEELLERPTRGGVPVLFPFPNRLRAGKLSANGREFILPLNDASGRNAIHGFTPRRPWRLTDFKGGERSASATVLFQMSRDAADAASLWPGDAMLELKVTLRPDALRIEATVTNAGTEPLPWGLGYHPYFAAAPTDRLACFGEERWELADNLPTGRRVPAEGDYDLSRPGPLGGLTLDDVYTAFPANAPPIEGQLMRANLLRIEAGYAVAVWSDPSFPHLVLFTPPHGRAVAVEPYTCPTDAAHLPDPAATGWRTLGPGEHWTGKVTYSVHELAVRAER